MKSLGIIVITILLFTLTACKSAEIPYESRADIRYAIMSESSIHQ